MADAGLRKSVEAMGNELRGGTSEEFRTFLDEERRRWAAVAKEANFKPENY